jgi:hypothetical protein
MKFKIKILSIFIIPALLIAKIALQTTNTPLTTTPSAISVQTNPIPIETPEDCIFPSQYYDIARLRCLNCPANSSAAENSKLNFNHCSSFVSSLNKHFIYNYFRIQL